MKKQIPVLLFMMTLSIACHYSRNNNTPIVINHLPVLNDSCYLLNNDSLVVVDDNYEITLLSTNKIKFLPYILNNEIVTIKKLQEDTNYLKWKNLENNDSIICLLFNNEIEICRHLTKSFMHTLTGINEKIKIFYPNESPDKTIPILVIYDDILIENISINLTPNNVFAYQHNKSYLIIFESTYQDYTETNIVILSDKEEDVNVKQFMFSNQMNCFDRKDKMKINKVIIDINKNNLNVCGSSLRNKSLFIDTCGCLNYSMINHVSNLDDFSF